MARTFGSCENPDDDADTKSIREMPVKDRVNELKARVRAEMEHRREMGKRVADMVVRQIKHPLGFCRSDGHFLWNNHYRVNISSTHDENGQTRLIIAKSFFVESNGIEIMGSVPELE